MIEVLRRERRRIK